MVVRQKAVHGVLYMHLHQVSYMTCDAVMAYVGQRIYFFDAVDKLCACNIDVSDMLDLFNCVPQLYMLCIVCIHNTCLLMLCVPI